MKAIRYLSRALVLLAGVVLPLLAARAASASITVATVPVGNPGNAADSTTGFGSVAYSYNIGEYDVTAGQYTAFLNAVASTDTYGLYNSDMNAGGANAVCGISQSGSPGNYTYATTKNPNFPVNFVSWGDAARFCNWLTNGQPTGAEDNGTTEAGSYTLNGAITIAALNAVTRNANADYVLPTEDEWYKAAYYNPSNSSYYLLPMQSNTTPSNVLSATGTNNANIYAPFVGYTDPTNYLTPVGAFADSPGPYGTYDQGGDVLQWNELVSGSDRGLMGASFLDNAGPMLSIVGSGGDVPTGGTDYIDVGFRVAQVPEPASLGILSSGGLGIWSLARRRRVVR